MDAGSFVQFIVGVEIPNRHKRAWQMVARERRPKDHVFVVVRVVTPNRVPADSLIYVCDLNNAMIELDGHALEFRVEDQPFAVLERGVDRLAFLAHSINPGPPPY